MIFLTESSNHDIYATIDDFHANKTKQDFYAIAILLFDTSVYRKTILKGVEEEVVY